MLDAARVVQPASSIQEMRGFVVTGKFLKLSKYIAHCHDVAVLAYRMIFTSHK